MELLIITICRATIDAFKASWPCHGIPEDADVIVIAVHDHGIPEMLQHPGAGCDLVDLDIEDSDGVMLDRDTYTDAGAALSALVDDAIRGHKTQPMEPGTIASAHRSY